jgi:serine phosphatase RsbU (regulator of sigma subunit)/PAS domain-containing protein
VHGEDRDPLVRALARARRTGTPLDVEFRLAPDDAAERHVRAVAHFALDAGRATWLGIACADVTEHRLRMEAATEAEHRDRTGTWTLDLRAGTFTASPEHARILGLSSDEHEHVVDEFADLVHTDDRALWHRATAALQHGATIRGLATRIAARDGYERHTITNVEPEFDGDGRVVRLHGSTRDVTEERALAALAREHETVEFLQRALLPEALPAFDGFDVAARYVAAGTGSRVGGDWYDAFVTRDGSLAVAVGDVAGHGVRTTAGMAQMRHAMRAYAFEGHGPGETLALLDELVTALAPDAFATAALFVCGRNGDVRYARAGHPHPLLADHEGVRTLAGGLRPPLGAGPKPAVEGRFVLAPGGTLVVYSDGLVEQRGIGLDRGIASLVRALGGATTPTATASASDCATALLDAAPGGRAPRDDVCVVVVRRAGGGP